VIATVAAPAVIAAEAAEVTAAKVTAAEAAAPSRSLGRRESRE
jgi:hypothetical protein